MTTVAAILPCRGRPEQTVTNVRRLLATAGAVPGGWQLYCVGGGDERDVLHMAAAAGALTSLVGHRPQLTYWEALADATQHADAPLLCGLANDLWACDDWLALVLDDYRAAFGDGDGLMGFAGDGHALRHSCHFLISRGLLARYGGWPVWYQHNFGDRELCARAQQDGVYAKSARAWLEHCHVERGLAPDDAVYAAGRATFRQDEALFVERRRLGWPRV